MYKIGSLRCVIIITTSYNVKFPHEARTMLQLTYKG